jgi:hypothetical protein
MKSPRTTLMREWLVRICLRARVTRAEEIPARTLAALVAGDWLMVMGHDPRARAL